MDTHPSPETVAALAEAAGVRLAPERPQQIAAAVAPVMKAVAGLAMPLEVEPASAMLLLARRSR
jgi:hypothetical protein